jgi:hypothetical protein
MGSRECGITQSSKPSGKRNNSRILKKKKIRRKLADLARLYKMRARATTFIYEQNAIFKTLFTFFRNIFIHKTTILIKKRGKLSNFGKNKFPMVTN